MIKDSKPFSEIIQSSLTQWLAQSWQWNVFPSFGSLVVVERATIQYYGIVYQIETGSMDPNRFPFPYQKTEEELLREQPQIFEFLKTTFGCIPIAFQDKGSLIYQWPSQPPPIHAFVRKATLDELKIVFARTDYLHTIFGNSSTITCMDELLLAIYRLQKNAGIAKEAHTKSLLQTYTMLYNNDYRRIKLLVQRVSSI